MGGPVIARTTKQAASVCSRFFSYTSYQSVRQSLLFPFANEEIGACVSYPKTDKLEVEFIREKSLCSFHRCASSSTSPSGPVSPPPPGSRPLLGSLPETHVSARRCAAFQRVLPLTWECLLLRENGSECHLPCWYVSFVGVAGPTEDFVQDVEGWLPEPDCSRPLTGLPSAWAFSETPSATF